MALFVCAGAAARRALNGDWLPERAFGIDILRSDSCAFHSLISDDNYEI